MSGDDRPGGGAETFHPDTVAVHGAAHEDAVQSHSPPIHLSSVFRFNSVGDMAATFRGERPGWIYGRYGTPTHALVERHLAALEGAPAALLTASGMAAIGAGLLALLKSGDHILAAADLYGGTRHLFDDLLGRLGITVSYFPLEQPGSLEDLRQPGTRAVYVESPTNPTLKVMDLADVVARARRAGLVSIVDNTFATPILQNPLGLGADLVVHSATKALAGHDDVVAGVVMGPPEHIERARDVMKTFGACLDGHSAWLLERGLKTLALRVSRQCDNAGILAEWLSRCPGVARVHYPGLPDHPGHAVARRQMRRFGGLLAFELVGGADAVDRFVRRLRLIRLAPTLGGTETLILVPAVSSHIRLTPGERAAIGVPDGLVRVSCGLEHSDDLRADLERALAS